jgi:hypothetical protein
MGRWWDILWMIIGVGVLVLVSTVKGLEFRYGAIGYLGALACIGYGVKALVDSYSEKKDLKRAVLKEPTVETFYRNTKEAWSDGRLKDLGSVFQQEGCSSSLKQLKLNYPAPEGSALEAFFTRFHPQPDEFLVSTSLGVDASDSAWFVLTNKRLLQKDGLTGRYCEFNLPDIRECVVDRENSELRLKTRGDETVVLKNAARFPKKQHLDVLTSSR